MIWPDWQKPHWGTSSATQAFDRRDFTTADGRDRQRTRAYRLTIDINRTGAALRDAAGIFRTDETYIVADRPEQRRVRINIDLMIATVDL
jgi:hypothetical protein